MNVESSLKSQPDGLTRRNFVGTFAMALCVLGLDPAKDHAAAINEISRTGESIHQEASFRVSRSRVYSVLTDAKEFDKVIHLSDAANRMGSGSAPTQISREVGGTFTLFGGHIIGRQVELVPDQRIVQAWRVVDWEPGAYSIARFDLKEQGAGTTLVFEHTGFPKGLAKHLADGWKGHYWEPLQKLLA